MLWGSVRCVFIFILSAAFSLVCPSPIFPLSALLSSITLNPNYPHVSQLCQTSFSHPLIVLPMSGCCLYLHYTSSSVLPFCWILLGSFAVYWYRLGKIKLWNWNKHLSGRVWSWRVHVCYWQFLLLKRSDLSSWIIDQNMCARHQFQMYMRREMWQLAGSLFECYFSCFHLKIKK